MGSPFISFRIGTNFYTVETRWTLKPQSPCYQQFGLSEQGPIFIAGTDNGFLICEDFSVDKTILSISTGPTQPKALAFSPSHPSQVVFAFPTGHLLLLDALRRTKDSSQWYNTQTSLLTDSSPLLVRWISATVFAVLLSDNSLWFFNVSYSHESTAIKTSLAQQPVSASQVSIAKSTEPCNPSEAWKFYFGAVIDLQSVDEDGTTWLVTGTRDGQVKVYNYTEQSLVSIFYSYFGAIRCIAVRHGLIVVGGEDDAVSVWNRTRKELVARCEGHRSWVTQVSIINECEFVSIGMDGFLCIWKIAEKVGEYSRDLLIPYPSRKEMCVLNPVKTIEVSQAGLSYLATKDSHFFIGDECGLLCMWSTVDK